MFGNIQKQCVRDSLKILAKQRGISVKELKAEIEETIEEACTSDDPEQQAIYQKLFGEKKPTPEEFIYKISKQTKS